MWEVKWEMRDETVFARVPDASELAIGKRFVEATETEERSTEATGPRRSDSKRGFRGSVPAGLTVWQRYAQTLLLTNEFIMLD